MRCCAAQRTVRNLLAEGHVPREERNNAHGAADQFAMREVLLDHSVVRLDGRTHRQGVAPLCAQNTARHRQKTLAERTYVRVIAH